KKEEGRRKKEEGRRKKEEGRRKKEEGRRKKEEGRRKKEEVLKYSELLQTSPNGVGRTRKNQGTMSWFRSVNLNYFRSAMNEVDQMQTIMVCVPKKLNKSSNNSSGYRLSVVKDG
ncbi:MAG: hypothetical protein QNJ47_24055, partial [Nostocaceae cyanobacterium]|nr:hypothetical protein [Nostocaceae cyanobacterium]